MKIFPQNLITGRFSSVISYVPGIIEVSVCIQLIVTIPYSNDFITYSDLQCCEGYSSQVAFHFKFVYRLKRDTATGIIFFQRLLYLTI